MSASRVTTETASGYVKTRDGVRLYYQVSGRGKTIILCSGLSVSFVYWKYLARELSKHYRVIQWNYRGHGKSDAPSDYTHATIYDLAEDLEAIRSHFRLDRCVLLGHSAGVQVILEYYRRYFDKVEALIPVLGTYGQALDAVFDTKKTKYVISLMYWMARFHNPMMKLVWSMIHVNPLRVNYHLVRLFKIVHPTKCSWEDFKPYFEHYKQLDMRTYFELMQSAQLHSAEDVLPYIHVPTLIIGGGEDRFTPVRISREMARNIEGCEYLEIPDGSHAALLEEPERINARIMSFLEELPART